MYGYEHVVPTFLPTAQVTMGGRDERQEALLRIKRNLAASGAAECVHYSFFSPAGHPDPEPHQRGPQPDAHDAGAGNDPVHGPQ